MLLVLAVLTFIVDEAQNCWRLITAASQSLARFWTDSWFCRHLSLHLSCYAPGMWVACPETTFYRSSRVSQLGCVSVSTLPSFLCPSWIVKYHSRGRSLAELDGWSCMLLFLERLVDVSWGWTAHGNIEKCYFIFPFPVSRESSLDDTPVHTALWADAREPLAWICRYKVEARVSMFLSLRWKINLFIVDCRFLTKSVTSRGLWTAAASPD